MRTLVETEFYGKRLKALLYFILCVGLAIGLTFLVSPETFSESQKYVMFLLFFALGMWITELIPAFAVSLFIMAYLVFTLGNKNFNESPQNVEKYVITFSSSIIWLMLGGFFLARAMSKTQLDVDLFKFTLKLSGNKPRNLVIGIMITTTMASMLMSNTATTAMILAAIGPLLASLGKKSGLTKTLLLGLPIAASTGGMCTIIGTPANALAAGALENSGIHIDFLTWMLYSTPVAILLTVIIGFVLIHKYLKDKNPIDLQFLDESKVERTLEMKAQRRIVLVGINLTVLLWLTTSIHGLSVAAVSVVPVVLFTLTRIMTGKDVQTLPWDTLLLVAGGLSLGVALQANGILDYYSQQIIKLNLSPYLFLSLLGFLTMVFSNIMSNTATATVLIPMGIAILPTLKLEVALVIGLCASTAQFLPVSSPANAVVFSTELLEQKDFRLNGIIMGILGPALIILWVLLIS